jgi:hydroxymethylbilane synthase
VQSTDRPATHTASVPLRIGTRGSRLALAQAHMVRARLASAEGVPEETHEIVVVSTAGDRILDRSLSEIGGKGLFTEEIEAGLLDGSLDLAVHSAKDMPTRLPDGLVLTGYLPREDVRDVLVGRAAPTLAALPPGAVVGTASLRRGALVRHRRPDLTVVTFRGNVHTRLAKLERGEADATLLALAGLKRLGAADEATEILPLDLFPPAVGQGAIAVETRADATELRARLAAILDPDTGVALACERAFLDALDGSCRTPIAGHATVTGDRVAFSGLILRPDGSETHGIRVEGAVDDAATLGAAAGAELKARAGAAFFDPA